MLTFLKNFFSRSDLKIIIGCTLAGGILQVISRQYLKSHPEFLVNKDAAKDTNESPKFLLPRGGAFIEISAVSVKLIGQVIINLLAKKGLLAGLLLGGGGIIINKVPLTAVSTYLSNAFPQNLPELEKTKFILVDGKKIYLQQCDQNLEYLIKILEDPAVPFEQKHELTRKILTDYLDLRTSSGRLNFALCITAVLSIFSIVNPSGFYIMMGNLITAIREGKISKSIGRLIIRRLKRQGIPIDPELLDAVD